MMMLLLFLCGPVVASLQAKTIVMPTEEVGICPYNMPYYWHGKKCTEAGTYTYTKTLESGDKEKYTLILYDMQLRTITAKILEGSRIHILGKDYTTPGTFYDTLFNSMENGCDTLVRINIYLGNYFHQYDTLHMCQDDPYPVWHNIQTDAPGTYFDRHKATNDRDSIYQLTLIKHYSVEYWDTIYVCSPQKVYYLNGERIDKTGDYDSHVKSPYGCDSTVHVRIEFVQTPEPIVNETFFCDNVTIIRDGISRFINKPTSFFDTIPSKCGCDSIIETRYTPYPTQLIDETIQIYEGVDVLNWHGKDPISEIGVYYDSLKNQHGCDSIYRLYVIPKHDTYFTVNTCAGEIVELENGFIIDKDTILIDSLKNSYGGDSLIHTSYNFVPAFRMTQSITICSNQYVTWKGHIPEGGTEEYVLHEGGIYTDRHRTKAGCDSIYEIMVNVLDAHIKDTVLVRCNDSLLTNPIRWTDSKGVTHVWSEPDRNLTFPDTMAHTTPEWLEFEDGSTHWEFNTGGCDSIINWHIVTGDFCSDLDIFYLCGNGSVVVDGKTYTKPGRYFNTFTTFRNLGVPDSIHNFEIIQVYPTEETREVTIHQLELPFEYEGQVFRSGGTHTIKLQTQYGCDSIIKLQLTVLPTIIKPAESYLICPNKGSYFEFPDGRRYYEPGNYLDTIYGGLKNDTIVQIDLRWAPTQFYNEPRYFLAGTSFTWKGHQQDGVDRVFDTKGVYWDSCVNKFGCDSIYRLELMEAEPFFAVDPESPKSLCTSELPFLWHGKSITQSGTYHDSLMTTFGLDSVWEIEVKVNPSYVIPIQIELCPGSEFIVDGRVITGDVYQDEQRTVDGCDSTIVYYINRRILSRVEETARFAENTSYEWHGKTFTHGGEYYDTLRTVRPPKCDSVIYHLHLIEERAFFREENITTCLSENETYMWHNRPYTQSGTYFDSLTTTTFGLDSVWQLNLTVNHDTVVQWHWTLCTNETRTFFDQLITEAGTYHSPAHARTGTGCDSIIELIVQTAGTEETVLYYTLCEGESIRIGDSLITKTCVYRDTLRSSLGCDSVRKHIVTVGKKYFFSSEQTINPGASYPWHKDGQPITLTQEGTYWDSCYTVFGCDSIYKLTLRFNQVEYIFPTETDYVCSADLPYVWHHKSLTETGLYYDSLQTDQGRDSVYSLYLTVFPTIHMREELNYCQGERPIINDVPYESDAVFTDTLTSYTGCDSIVDYVLHFRPRYELTSLIHIRDGEQIPFGDQIISTSGVYFHHFYTQYGCDSLVTLNVQSCTTPEEVVYIHDLCEGDQLTIGGQTISTSGTYRETRTTADGCDSLVKHIVNVHTAYHFSTSAKICKGSGAYKWVGHFNDTVLTNQGVYYDSLTTVHGCDSIYRLILNYNQMVISDTMLTYCWDDLPYIYKGERYYKDSVFLDTLGVTAEGCDSILRWNYSVNYHCSDYAQYNHCPGQVISIDGLLISEPGAYEQHHLTPEGQDSLYRFVVHDVQNYEFTTRLSGCDSIVYDGRTFYARGAGNETFNVDLHHTTVDGCDSLEHLVLTLYMSSTPHVFSKTIADYDSIRFGPYYHNTTGVYTMHYTNAQNCDSAEILHLTVLKTEYPETKHYYICEGDPNGVEVFGQRIYPTQEYTFIADSTWIAGVPVIRTADIYVQHPFTVSRFEPNADQVVCADHEVLFYVNYATVDQTVLPDYYEVDFYVGKLEAHPLHQEGMVDGKTTLPIIMGGQGKYVTPGQYSYRLKLRSESCVMSDTILTGSIVIRYPEDVMESAWNDAVLLVNEQYNGGGWKFQPPYRWQVLSSQGVDKTARVVTDATQPYLYSSALEEGDRIIATLIREGYEDPIPSCEYIFVPTLSIMPNAILVYPSAVRAKMPIKVSAPRGGSYRLLDYTGRIYNTGTFMQGETQINMPGMEGCYILVLEDEKGNMKKQKVIVY